MEPKVAFCTHLTGSYEKSAKMAAENGMTAIEHSFTENSIASLGEETNRIKEILGPECEIRYHAVFNNDDIGAADIKQARNSMKNLMHAVRAVSDAGGWFMTVHTDLKAQGSEDLRYDNTGQLLKELNEFGNENGVLICVENLRSGVTSDNERLKKIVEFAEIGVTFDIGHAAGPGGIDKNADMVQAKIRTMESYIVNAHIYGTEDKNGHEPPGNIDVIGLVLDQLIMTECDWWTIELGDPKDLHTMYEYIRGYLDSLKIGNDL